MLRKRRTKCATEQPPDIYRTEKAHLGTFLETIRSILHSMAGHAQEIETIFELNFKNSVDTMSKETRHITLLYHQVRRSLHATLLCLTDPFSV